MSAIQQPDLSMMPQAATSTVEVAKQLDYENKEFSAPVYKYRQFSQVSGGQSLALTTSTTLSQFIIPGSSVWNFAKSYLSFAVSVADVNNNYHVAHADTLPIDSIQLMTSSGAILANLQNVQAYLKAAQPLTTHRSEFFSRGQIRSKSRNVCFGLNPANSGAGVRTTAEIPLTFGSNAAITDVVAGATQATSVLSAQPASAVSGSDRSDGVQHLATSEAKGDGGGAGDLTYLVRIPFSAFSGTLLAYDKDFFAGGDNLQLQIYFSQVDRWGFRCTDLTAVAGINAFAPVISQYALYLAEDINSDITEPLKAKVMSEGVSLMVPYTISSQYTTGAAAGYYTSNIPITAGQGLKLKRILTIPIMSANTLKLTANTFNVGSVKYSDVWTQMDSRPLQDRPLVMNDGDLYNYLYEKCKNSVALLSQRIFEESCFWVDDFSDCDDTTKIPDNDCKLSGLEVSQAKNYAIRLNKTTTAASLTLCHYSTWVRNLIVKPGGLNWGQ